MVFIDNEVMQVIVTVVAVIATVMRCIVMGCIVVHVVAVQDVSVLRGLGRLRSTGRCWGRCWSWSGCRARRWGTSRSRGLSVCSRLCFFFLFLLLDRSQLSPVILIIGEVMLVLGIVGVMVMASPLELILVWILDVTFRFLT